MRKTVKNDKKDWSDAINTFSVHVFAMVTMPLQRTAAKIKTGAVSSKFCLVSHGVIGFVVSLILFEKIQFS